MLYANLRKTRGGDIDATGVVYLSGFNLKRFYFDTKTEQHHKFRIQRFLSIFTAMFSIKGLLDAQNITGDVRVNRARYRERVEWKSWLLKAKTAEKPRGELTGQ